MKVLWITVILALSISQTYAQETCCDEYCFGTDKERLQTLRFTSKTAYTLAKGHDLDLYVKDLNCEPTKVWTLSRHGTRLPSAKTIEKAASLDGLRDQILKNYDVLRSKPDKGALCMEDLFSIKLWKFNTSLTPDKENMLTPQGWDDLRLTARAYQRWFGNILTKEYDAPNFLFRYTDTQRTEESFKAYAEGLFGPNVWQNIYISKPQGNGTLLRPYDFCPKWQENNNEKEDTEFYKFMLSSHMNKTVSDVSKRLGFKYDLEFKDIELMWDMCRYEQAWNVDRTSPWCAAFTSKQIEVLEYWDDLRYYKKSGYGSKINSNLPCEIIKDMLNQLNSKTKPFAVTSFAHSTLIQTMITGLGWYKDSQELTASNFEDMKERQWRTSKIDPFASNLVAVKYHCDKDISNPEKVQFFLNQKLVNLDFCKNHMCDWSEVMKRYDNIYNADCNEEFCVAGASSISAMSLLTFLISAVVYLIY